MTEGSIDIKEDHAQEPTRDICLDAEPTRVYVNGLYFHIVHMDYMDSKQHSAKMLKLIPEDMITTALKEGVKDLSKATDEQKVRLGKAFTGTPEMAKELAEYKKYVVLKYCKLVESKSDKYEIDKVFEEVQDCIDSVFNEIQSLNSLKPSEKKAL